MAKFPDHLSGRVTLGWALLDLGRYDEARTELEQVLKRAPDNLAAIRGLAELHDRAESTMYLDMPSPGAWPPEPSASETDDAPAQEFARNVAEAATHEPDPVWQAPPAPSAPASLPVALSSESDTPEFITTAQAAMQDLPRVSDERVAADVLDAAAAPIELVSTAEAAFGRAEATDGPAAALPVASMGIEAPVVIETAAQAIAPRATTPATVEVESVVLASPADYLAAPEPSTAQPITTQPITTQPITAEPAAVAQSKAVAQDLPAPTAAADPGVVIGAKADEPVELDAAASFEPGIAAREDAQTLDLVAALTGGTGALNIPEPIVALPAFDALLEDDLDDAIAGLADTPGLAETAGAAAGVVDVTDEALVASLDDGVDVDLASALADAGAASAAAAFELAQQGALDRAAEMAIARHDASDLAAAPTDAGRAPDEFGSVEAAAPSIELDLVPADAVDAMAASAEIAANLERAAIDVDAADASASTSSAAPDHAGRMLEIPAGDAEFLFAQHAALGRADEPEDVDTHAAVSLERETSEAGAFSGAEAFPQPAFEPVVAEPITADRAADDLVAAMSAAADWEPPVAAAPAVVEAVEPVAEMEAPAAAAEPYVALVEPPTPAPPVVEEVVLELATAHSHAGEPLVDLELGAPDAVHAKEPLVLLELDAVAATGPAAVLADVSAPPATLPDLQLLELTELPIEEPAAPLVLQEAEPFRSNGASAYDATREAETPRSGRGAKGKARKGKAAPKTSPLPALERLLRSVETRRAEITSETVA